ncbi:MAG: D-glycerate dehydrogenase [Cyclobacteriaceae bacterium]
MKVLVSLYIPQLGIDMLKAHPKLEVTVWDKDRLMTREELLSMAKGYDILLASSNYVIDEEFIEKCPNIKMISTFSVGYDNVNIALLNKHDIPFGNAPGAMTDATADVAFGLMIAVCRKMFYMYNMIPKNNWSILMPRANLGQEPKGKALGIFGMGKIGMEMARRCKGAYGMDIYYHNRNRNPEAEQELDAKYVSFEELLKVSDIVSTHCALTTETKGIFNKEAFKKMKSSAIFINTARGGVHNEPDLIDALNNQEIWGAGLDVTNPEPMKADNPLLFMENVCVLPHIGSATVKARDEMARLAALNIIQYANGEDITNRVLK